MEKMKMTTFDLNKKKYKAINIIYELKQKHKKLLNENEKAALILLCKVTEQTIEDDEGFIL